MTTWNYDSINLIENPLNLEDGTDRLLENGEIRLLEFTGIYWDEESKNNTTWSQDIKNNTVWSSPAIS